MKCRSCGEDFEYIAYYEYGSWKTVEVIHKKYGDDIKIAGPVGHYHFPVCPYCCVDLNRPLGEKVSKK